MMYFLQYIHTNGTSNIEYVANTKYVLENFATFEFFLKNEYTDTKNEGVKRKLNTPIQKIVRKKQKKTKKILKFKQLTTGRVLQNKIHTCHFVLWP